MGGGAIRVAAKVAGITAASGGLRGIAAEHYSISSAARRAASVRPPAATVEDVKLVTSQVEAGVQRPCLEMDDWVFAGGGERRRWLGSLSRCRGLCLAGCPLFRKRERPLLN
ncbi:UNVERIFIED_CONTAM: hypothetical protein Slati_4001300 [Sesamum latifolium]|uniref:Uncharacterized protein n=1 Tax=Sesamum latifolium TaxID=2727402 RepID=A0AAW2TQW5_9LAMI